jgi:hypothetical protein
MMIDDPAAAAARAEAVEYLRKQIPEKTKATILEGVRTAGRKKWMVSQHFAYGMAIRNNLRAAGFTADALGVDDLDNHWADFLWEAITQ